MDSKKLRQITNSLKKSLENWDYKLAINASKDETQTRDNLIHPFLNLLNYQKLVDYTHEFVADIGDKKKKKVDVAITLGKKDPIMLIECKSVGTKLNDNHFSQLNVYCINSPSSVKIGILTNGVEYNFYTVGKNKGLNIKPFFKFDITNYGIADLETLALFSRQDLEVKDILELADEIYFLDEFDNALFKTLSLKDENDLFFKAIFQHMGGQRATPKIIDEIKQLVNSVSIKTALEKVVKMEIAASNTGVITTEEEVKAYNVIKTILALSPQIKDPQLTRISYRDMKNKFAIIVDDVQTKNICSLVFKEKSKIIEIGGTPYTLDDVTVASITKLKKQLTESALKQLI